MEAHSEPLLCPDWETSLLPDCFDILSDSAYFCTYCSVLCALFHLFSQQLDLADIILPICTTKELGTGSSFICPKSHIK